eukprot:180653-Prymnesium_polylepis.2
MYDVILARAAKVARTCRPGHADERLSQTRAEGRRCVPRATHKTWHGCALSFHRAGMGVQDVGSKRHMRPWPALSRRTRTRCAAGGRCARLRIDDHVHVALAVALVHVRQARPLVRKRPDRF